jgi:L,D-peptidoglycan transpeptidase YkuD (ErfK/YbiS/YcfS/YnhG family)
MEGRMRRLTVALTIGVALVLSGFPSGLPQADAAAVRCDVRGGTAARVIDVASSGTGATVRGCQRQADGTYRQAVGPYSGRVGYNGVISAASKREGDGRTPAGLYWLRNGFGALANPGLARPWTVVGSNHFWVDDSRSRYYNTMQLGPANGRWTSAEKLLNRPAYDYAQVIGYNEARKPYAGSAIFLHVGTGRATAGCVSVSASALVSLLRWQGSSAQIEIS